MPITVRWAVVAMLLLTACTREATDITPGTEPPAADGDELVLRMDISGGLMPLEERLSGLPQTSIYVGGRAIVMGAQIAIYPPPALPPLFERTISTEGLQQVREDARDAGLDGPDRTLRAPTIADAPTTTFTYVDTDGDRHVIAAEALGIGEGGEGEDPQLREKLAGLRENLSSLESWLGPDAVGPEEEFEFERMRVFVTQPREHDPSVEPNEIAWPVDIPLSEFGEPLGEADVRCGVVAGDELDALVERAREATAITRWISEGEAYALALRPMLPDEEECPDEVPGLG